MIHFAFMMKSSKGEGNIGNVSENAKRKRKQWITEGKKT